MAQGKVVGPATTITFLGIEIDSAQQIKRLPNEKLTRLKAYVQGWGDRRSASKHQLQQLMGHLNHAAVVVKPGRSFLHGIIEALKRAEQKRKRVRLNVETRADIAWWKSFLPLWNGYSLTTHDKLAYYVTSDASGSWGCGAINNANKQWFQVEWPQEWLDSNIVIKEMLPIVIGAAIWGQSWKGRRVHFVVDNMAVVSSLSKRRVKCPLLAHLLRCLFFFEAHFGFEHCAEHIAGRLHVAADALSRDNVQLFHSIFPQAPQRPTQIPASLLQLLWDRKLSWTSNCWSQLFNDTLSVASLREPEAHISQPSEPT